MTNMTRSHWQIALCIIVLVVSLFGPLGEAVAKTSQAGITDTSAALAINNNQGGGISPLTGQPGYTGPDESLAKTRVTATPAHIMPSLIAGGLYGTDGLNLYIIDKNTGTATLIGPHGPVEFGMGALAFDKNGVLYGMSLTGDAKLYRIDPTTGAATAVGPLGIGFIFEGGLGFDPSGQLFGVNQGDESNATMFKIDTTTGAATIIGPMPGEPRDIDGVTVEGSIFYAIDRVSNSLGTLDFFTGAYTPIGNPNVIVGATGGLAVDPADGTLYATFASGGFYKLDKSTGAATLIAINGVNFGLEFAPLSSADLSITKSDSPDPVTAGATLTYTLTVTNNGPSDATGVIVTDPLPAGITLVSATASPGSCGGAVSCNLGTLASGASATITIVVTVDAAMPCGTVLTNTASVVSNTLDPNAGNNTTSADTVVACPADLSIAKTAAPDPVTAGNELAYTLTVTNNGPAGATGVIVTDTLPAGVTLVSATPSQGTCGGAVTCALGNLASGSSVTITIIATVDPALAGGVITNTASVTGTETDPDPANNTASAETRVMGLCTILDDFNRPNGPLGSNWDGRIRGYKIRDTQVAVRAGGPIYWQPESYGPNQEACVTLTRINPKSRQHALLLKVQGLDNWRKGAILVSYNARSGNVEVKARDVSAHRWILVGSFTPATPVVDGDQLRARAFADGTVEVLINNVSLGSADAGSFYVDKGGQIGLWFRNPLGGNDDGDDDDDEDDDDKDQRLIQEELLDEKITGRRAILDDFGGGTIAAP